MNYGEKYHSLHEGYAVLLEEIEEVKPEITQLLNSFDVFWLWVKRNNQGHKYLCVEDMYKATENAIKELAQVGAVLWKIGNTIKTGFKEGAELGYKKANEWHNLRKNPDDLPKADTLVRVRTLSGMEHICETEYYEPSEDEMLF